MRRSVALSELELKFTAQFGRLMLADGTELNASEYMASLRSVLAANTWSPLPGVGVANLATALLDAAASGKQGRAMYSALSSVAHGEATGVSVFLVGEVGRVRMRLPAIVAYEYAGMLFGACTIVARDLIEYANLEPEYRARWDAAHARAGHAIRQIQRLGVTPEDVLRDARSRRRAVQPDV